MKMIPTSATTTTSSWLPMVIGAVVALTMVNLRALILVEQIYNEYHFSSLGSNIYGNNTKALQKQIDDMLRGLPSFVSSSKRHNAKKKKQKTTVAYAVSVTKCLLNQDKDSVRSTLDRAAVLHQSIKVAHGHRILPQEKGNGDKQSTGRIATTTTSSSSSVSAVESRFDFHMHAFVHLNASACVPYLQQLGYITHVRDTPVHESEMPEALSKVQHNSCCGDLEWSKLYTYLLTDYPVATHLDLDTIVLKVMDDVFDLIIDQPHNDGGDRNDDVLDDHPESHRRYNRSRFVDNRENAMWVRDKDRLPERVDFVFTRDYNMVNPPNKQVHQIGVQGGFLVVRPNATEFERLREIVRQGGDFEMRAGWGGETKAYGGYFGAGTIQGLASYYYNELSPNRSVEVNRCYYNTMVDTPYHVRDGRELCRTLEPDGTCEDCRMTPFSQIYTAHFTCCGKPEWCNLQHPKPLCRQLLAEWHRIRFSLEQEWVEKYGPNGLVSNITKYDPRLATIFHNSTDPIDQQLALARGHCKRPGGYLKLNIPDVTDRLM